MIKSILALVFVVVIQPSLWTASGVGRPVASIQIANFSANDRTMNILVALAIKYQVVIGVQGVLVGDDSQRIEVELHNTTVKDVLDAIVSRDSRFSWHEVRDGIVQVELREPRLALMDLTVGSFIVEHPNRQEIVGLLNEIPEVRSWLGSHRCTMDEIWAGPPPRNWDSFAVRVENMPLSAVFDEIALNSHTYFWSAIQFSRDPCSINVRP